MAPLLLLSKDLHVLAASPSYFEAFRASRESVEGHPVGKTDNGRWSMPAVRALLEKALEQDTPRASLTLSHDDPVVARVRLIAQRSFSEGRTDPVILLVIEPEGFPRQSETP